MNNTIMKKPETTAKKIVITGKGGPEVVEIQDYLFNEPKDNEVCIKVIYAGLAYADLMLQKVSMPGLPPPPFTPGADATGIIDKVGKNVKSMKKGDLVAALLMSDFGGQAQYINVDQNRVHQIPAGIPEDKALCLMINYLTAYQMLKQTGILTDPETNSEKGKILVHGGSGGVGSALVQISKAFGFTVISTASEKNISFVQNMGAEAIDYRKVDFVSYILDKFDSVDYVLDSIGGDYVKRSLKILKKGGIYVGYGFQQRIGRGMPGIISSLSQFMIHKILNPNKKLLSFQLRDSDPKFYKADLNELFQLYIEMKIDPPISEIIPLNNAVEAYKKLEAGDRKGKILIKA